jgi:hypothetical protein
MVPPPSLRGKTYTLSQSSCYPGLQPGSFDSLTNTDYNKSGTGTNGDTNSFVMATFNQSTYVNFVLIGRLSAPGGWNCSNTNGKLF